MQPNVSLTIGVQPSTITQIFSGIEKIGPLVTLMGVLVTIAVNIWIARRNEGREREKEARKSEAELQVFRIALAASITSLRTIVEREIDFIRNNHGTWVPLLDFFELYRANLDKIGRLTALEAEAVIQAHFAYQENAGYIKRKTRGDARSFGPGFFAAFDFKRQPHLREEIIKDLETIARYARTAEVALRSELAQTDVDDGLEPSNSIGAAEG